jgi:hypothetical protein
MKNNPTIAAQAPHSEATAEAENAQQQADAAAGTTDGELCDEQLESVSGGYDPSAFGIPGRVGLPPRRRR